MFLREITTDKELNVFVADHPDGQFLQSWEWGEFQKSLGRNVWRVGVYSHVGGDDSSSVQRSDSDLSMLVAVATVIEHTLRIGKSYLYCPYGPVFATTLSSHQIHEALGLIMSSIRDITIETQHQEEIFCRIEPRIGVDHADNYLVNTGFKIAHAMQPQDTWVVDVRARTDQLLRAMHQKTRYNIRLAQKKGVVVREAIGKEDVAIFWHLLQQTTARDGFCAHERLYYEQLWEFFNFSDTTDQMHLTVRLLLAEYDSKPIAASLLGLYGERVTYLHGASNYHYRHVMAPQLLQWHGMKLAHELGYHWYDFNGIQSATRPLTKRDKEYAWGGITRFKKSFGGEEVNYIGAWDWVYDRTWYRLYKVIRMLRNKLRFL